MFVMFISLVKVVGSADVIFCDFLCIGGYLSVFPVVQLGRQLGVRFYIGLHLLLVKSRCISDEGQVDFEFAFKTKANFWMWFTLILIPD